MPGVFNLSVDEGVKEGREAHALGVPAVILFGLPESKDEVATGAWDENGIVQQAARAFKREVPELILIGDVCLCEYMSHGHCGIVSAAAGAQSLGAAALATPAIQIDYEILNDETLELLARTSISLARAGIDIIAPSDMMDGRVAAIRRGLDEAGFINTPILSYAAKFASGFYGPFREAADLPLAAYQVSGEYAMIEAAARNNWIDRDRVMMESLLSIRRAGASIILTYYAKEAARLLA
jgi:porphobilinogen synthase